MKTRRSQRRTAPAPVVTEEKAESTATTTQTAASNDATTDDTPGRRSRRAAAAVAAAAVTVQSQSFRAPPRSPAAMAAAAAASAAAKAATTTSKTTVSSAKDGSNNDNGAHHTSTTRGSKKVTRAVASDTSVAATGTTDTAAATTNATSATDTAAAPAKSETVGRRSYRLRKELEDYLPPGEAWEISVATLDGSLEKTEEIESVNGKSSLVEDSRKKKSKRDSHDDSATDGDKQESEKDELMADKKPKRRSPRIQTSEAVAKAPAREKQGVQSSGSNAVSSTKGDVGARQKAASVARKRSSQPVVANGEDHQVDEDDDEEGDADVPMKEIRLMPPSKEPEIMKMPDDLDEHTLTTVKTHLASNNEPRTKLSDDEVVAFMLRMNRQTHQQAEHQKILVGDMGESQASEIYEDILAEEEEHALGREFYHEMMAQIHERQTRRSVNLDKRTLGWIRKATGLHRGTPGDAARDSSTNVANECAPSTGRRYTRGMAKHTRKARVEKGLSSLTAAANQIDKEFGPFVVKKPTLPPKRPRAFFPDDDDDGRHKKRHKDIIDADDDLGKLSKKERKKLKRKEQELMEAEKAERVMAELRGHNDVGNGRSTTHPRHASPRHLREVVLAPPSKQSSASPDNESAPLRMHDWLRRERVMVEGKSGSKEPSDKGKEEVRLPSSCIKLGIKHHVPKWTKVSPRVASDRSQIHFPPRRRHEDSVYASLCDKLMKQLAGKARSRIRYEFFYSDLDRQWYNRNEFVRAAAKLGVRPGALLTRQEWKVVRKLIPNKPRIFSRRFIASQMSERNKYRNSLRMLQNDPNPAMAQRLGFDYEVPARIPIGATVTAFNSRYRMLERGVVLSYEEARGKYYVKLPYSNHFCSDFDVARHGLSDVIMPAPENMVLGDMERKLEFGYTHAERLLQHNATMGPMTETTMEPRRWTVDDEIRGLFEYKAFTGSSADGKRKAGVATPKPNLPTPPMVEKVAEYEMLVSVMIALEAATERKRMILDRLDSMHSLAADNRGRLPDHLHEHYPWLLANLDSVNEVLSTAHSCLQNLYGSIYLPSSSISMDRLEILECMLGQKLSTRGYSSDQDSLQRMEGVSYGESRHDEGQTVNDGGQRNLFGGAADQWLVRLLLDSEDIGGRVVSELHWPDMSDENAQFMHDRIYGISSLLLALSYGLEGATGPRRTDSTAANAAVAIAQKEVTSLTFPPAPLTAGNNVVGNEDAEVYVGTLNARNLAMDDLKHALDLLNAEHTAASVHASLGTSND